MSNIVSEKLSFADNPFLKQAKTYKKNKKKRIETTVKPPQIKQEKKEKETIKHLIKNNEKWNEFLLKLKYNKIEGLNILKNDIDIVNKAELFNEELLKHTYKTMIEMNLTYNEIVNELIHKSKIILKNEHKNKINIGNKIEKMKNEINKLNKIINEFKQENKKLKHKINELQNDSKIKQNNNKLSTNIKIIGEFVDSENEDDNENDIQNICKRIVIDNGSYQIKAGFSGANEPNVSMLHI